MEKYIYETKMEVRDYECDIEGIVNNANYLHYFEHTRHRFLKTTGLSFSEMHNRGIDAVVARLKMAFKVPLKSGDEFVCRMRIKKEGVRFVFYQDIFREKDEKLCCRATVELVCLINGKLGNSDEYDRAFAPYFAKKD